MGSPWCAPRFSAVRNFRSLLGIAPGGLGYWILQVRILVVGLLG